MSVPEYRPSQPSFDSLRLRLERAETHLEQLQTEARAYFDRDPIVPTAYPGHREGEWAVILVEEIREWPDPEWGIFASEFTHQLRSTLDNLVCQLVLLRGKEEPGEQHQFPIYTKRPAPPERLDDMLGGVYKRHRTFIEKVQPNGGSDECLIVRRALNALVHLSNADKHRFLHPGVAVRERNPTIGPILSDRPGGPVEVQATHGTLYEGAELVRFRAPDTPDAYVDVEGEVSTDIAFGQPDLTTRVMRGIYERIIQVIERFKPDFPA